MKRIFRIVGFLIAVASCAFAQPSDSSSTLVLAPNASEASSENLWVDLGVVLDGAFGMWNIKLQEDHLKAPHVAFGLSGLIGFNHFAFRLSALGEYEAVYVSEGTQATINEGFWRLGGGAAVRFQSSKEKGVWAELGSAVMVALQDKITLCESQEQSIYWGLESHVKVPLEISAGYRFPLGAVSLEAALFGAYDLTNSTTFVVNERKHDARAWNVGARFVLWAVRL